MRGIHTAKKIALFLGDVIALYLALFITLMLRHGLGAQNPVEAVLATAQVHLWPFSWVHAMWLTGLFAAGMYDWENWPPTRKFYTASLTFNTMLVNFALAMGLFYAVPAFGITPKTNLVIDAALAALFLWWWRMLFLKVLSRKSKIKVIFLGGSSETNSFADYLNRVPSLGYKVLKLNGSQDILREGIVDLVVAEPEALRDEELVKKLYQILPLGISVVNFADFYEHITGKVPTSLVGEEWFLQNFSGIKRHAYETSKRALDAVLALFLAAIAILLLPFIGLAIALSTPKDVLNYKAKRAREGDGIIFFRQPRVGKNGKVFNFIKFRSQRLGAEKMGFAKEAGDFSSDQRQYFIGRILRKTYIDELPQIINVLKGDMSFVGPRPERTKYVEELKKLVPFYEMRLLVKPGITGWAQISMKDDASVEDAPVKIQYDLYYIKNRTLFMDLAIMLKTASIMLKRSGK